jgi:hypothetical protein
VEQPRPTRVLVVGPQGVALLSQRGKQVRDWAWSELGGATVDRVEAVGREWEALVLWSRGEHRLAQLAFTTVGSGFFERMGRSTVEPEQARAVILDRLAQYESARGTGPA